MTNLVGHWARESMDSSRILFYSEESYAAVSLKSTYKAIICALAFLRRRSGDRAVPTGYSREPLAGPTLSFGETNLKLSLFCLDGKSRRIVEFPTIGYRC
jgi:hypothetical protein